MSGYSLSTLKNGLTVVSYKMAEGTGVCRAFLGFPAGNRQEHEGEEGVAHLMEHVLMQGSRNYPGATESTLILDKLGAYQNAHTGLEYIYLEEECLSSDLDTAISIMADRAIYPLFPKDVLINEKKAIEEEYRRKMSNPDTAIYEKLPPLFFGDHPLSKTAFRKMQSVHDATPEMLNNYHKRLFHPHQAILVIAGDIAHHKVLDLAFKYLENWRTDGILHLDKITKLNPKHERLYKTEQELPTTKINISFHIPPAKEIRAGLCLNAVSDFLTGGMRAHLMEKLRHETGLVYGVRSGRDSYSDAGRFFVDSKSQKPQGVVEIIFSELAKLSQLITEDVVAEIKHRAHVLLARAEIFPQTIAKGLFNQFITNGEMMSPNETLSVIDSLAREEIVAVATKYLTKENSMTMIIGPKNQIENVVV